MKNLIKALEKLSLERKLVLLIFISIVMIISIGTISLKNINRMADDMETLYSKDTLGISYLGEAKANLIYIGRALRSMLISQDDATRDSFQSLISIRQQAMEAALSHARETLFRKDIIAEYYKLRELIIPFYQMNERVQNLILKSEAGKLEAQKLITSPEFIAIVKAADEQMDLITRLKLDAAASSIINSKEDSSKSTNTLILASGMGLFFSIVLGLLISRTIKRPYDEIRLSVTKLADGDVEQPIPCLDYKNDVGLMAHAVNTLREIYRESKDQFWVKAQISSLLESIQATEDFADLTKAVISKVTPLIGAGHGAFYVGDEASNYHLIASYGYRERKNLSNVYGLGDGLVGQCALEKVTIKLRAPKDYIQISSGLGEGPPSVIIVLPVIHQYRVLGVIEFASFQDFHERETTLLEEMLPILATNMEILDRNVKTRELLVATKEQALRMEMQAAQLEEQTVEMEAQQSELLDTENWYRSIMESAPDGMLVIDGQGRVLLSNLATTSIFGYSAVELKRVNIKDLITDKAEEHSGETKSAVTSENTLWTPVIGKHKEGLSVELGVIWNTLPIRGNQEVTKCLTLRVLASAE